MPPFMNDAMGDTFRTESDAKDAAKNSFYIMQETGIPLSATFNSLWVRPDQKNLDIWIENFTPLYNIGVKTVTLPHTSWVSTGQIQKEFPELYIKNTILREVARPNEIVSLATSGFHYVNLDRDLMRDKELLLRIKKAKEYCADKGKPIKISLLVNDGCWGGCPIMPEHYHINATREGRDPQFFYSEISRVSCSRWDVYDPASALKGSNLPPWKADWEEFFDLGIDVFKFHGRDNAIRMKESMDIIAKWDADEELLYNDFDPFFKDLHLKDAPINIWRDKIKTCKFDCWDCNYCESVVESSMKKEKRVLNPLIDRVIKAIDGAVDNNSNFKPEGYDVLGLSSSKVRHFLNNMCSVPGTVYVDAGCYMGSTLFAALMGNKDVRAYAIDDYSAGVVKPRRKDLHSQFEVENPIQTFVDNTEKWMSEDNSVGLSVRPIHEVEYNPQFPPNVVFYDADNQDSRMVTNLEKIHSQAADSYVLIVDDANFEGVIETTEKFLKDKTVVFERKLLTKELEDANDWWNGMYIVVVDKTQEGAGARLL